MSSFAVHQRPSAQLFNTMPAATTHAPECCPSICLCSTGACEARQVRWTTEQVSQNNWRRAAGAGWPPPCTGKGHLAAPAASHAACLRATTNLPSLQHGQTTEENELAEQLCSELLSSSGSTFNFAHFDGASADAAAAAAAAAAVAEAAAALADLLCHAGCPQEAAAAVSHLFPAAHSISVHCSTAACPGQLTLVLHPAQHGACCFDACTCSAADVLLRSAAAVCTLDCGQQPLSEAEQAALAALGEMLGRQLRQHVKQQLEVSGCGLVWLCHLRCCSRAGCIPNPACQLTSPPVASTWPAHAAPSEQPMPAPPPLLQVLHAAVVSSLRIQGAPSAHCTKQLMGH